MEKPEGGTDTASASIADGDYRSATLAGGKGAGTAAIANAENAALKNAAKEGAATAGVDVVGSLPKPPGGPGSVPKMQRDPKRLWYPGEREAKRIAQGGECATGCGMKIDASNSRGHHKQRHADGGRTDDANHAEICVECHLKLHSR